MPPLAFILSHRVTAPQRRCRIVSCDLTHRLGQLSNLFHCNDDDLVERWIDSHRVGDDNGQRLEHCLERQDVLLDGGECRVHYRQRSDHRGKRSPGIGKGPIGLQERLRLRLLSLQSSDANREECWRIHEEAPARSSCSTPRVRRA